MIRITNLRLSVEHDDAELEKQILKVLKSKADMLLNYTVFKRSPDVRNRRGVTYIYTIDAEVKEEDNLLKKLNSVKNIARTPDMKYKYVAQAPKNISTKPVIIGMGPAGIFAALILAEMGFKPLVFERGKEVRKRTVDTFNFWRNRNLNTESNVQFGEGGAGTFSDGKLYTQIKDPKFYSRKVFDELIKGGAKEELRYVNKPHIGTFRLVKIVENMRKRIIELGGAIHFEERVDRFDIEKGVLRGIETSKGAYYNTNHLVLAIGHSARDTFEQLLKSAVYIEPKPFSIGFRIEHPQSLINQCRYGVHANNPLLGSADYKLVHHCKNGRSVYSFCMCPGGTVVGAASEEGGVVTNGMSQYSRKERNANAGIVVGITPMDFPDGVLGGMELQRSLEQRAFKLGGENYNAPGQLIGDFLKGKPSQQFGVVHPSYTPGVTMTSLETSLPNYAIEAIREAIPAFDKKIPGFAMPEGLITGVETRTSSPIRIKRDAVMQSINTKGLYPTGEGAGYAGGILSAAIDGIKVAEAVALDMVNNAK